MAFATSVRAHTCAAGGFLSDGFILFYPNEQRGGVGGGGLPDFYTLFSCSADYERDWPSYKVVFRVGNQYAECEKQQQTT